MASSKYKVCALALTELGLRPISSFQDTSNTEAAQICGIIWDDFSKYILSIHSWRFTMKKRQLGRSTDNPLNEWRYAYDKPVDLLRLHAIFDGNGIGIMPYHGYELFNEYIYSDATTLWADYQANVEPQNWPYWFVEFAVVALAAKLAPILSRNDLADIKFRQAYGTPSDNLLGGLLGQAKRIDSMQMPVEPITSFELISERFR